MAIPGSATDGIELDCWLGRAIDVPARVIAILFVETYKGVIRIRSGLSAGPYWRNLPQLQYELAAVANFGNGVRFFRNSRWCVAAGENLSDGQAELGSSPPEDRVFISVVQLGRFQC